MPNRKDLAYIALKDCHVSGKYCGIPFSGLVIDRTWHKVDPHMVLVWIDLDKSIIGPSGLPTKSICLNYSSIDWISEWTYIDHIDNQT